MIPDAVEDRRVAFNGMIQPGRRTGRALFKVGNEKIVGGIDPEEIVHVHVRAVGLSSTFCDQRDRVGKPAGARLGADTGTLFLDPGFESEIRCAEGVGWAEGDIIVDAVE